ncbi:hypothetical protein [Burkholderia lata]|uniref:Uncharacterized protein n=1 Tax=Burkholderia lata (strain ATCC 17760 / DSM 23089 / LMG 22485 / NCIMB 9086 / R18194 / 383) TaxID=482957 RepID=A0A6P2GR65_BURL3|nr:hypothetical protein [Burkholderia lata]VWB06823.1 hypothetical protein BLA6863_00136 [Burkholderia lata]
MDYSTVAGVGGAAAGGLFAVLAYMLKRSVSQMDQKLRDQDTKLEAHEKQMKEQDKAFDAYRLHVAETYAPNSALEKAIDRFSASVDAVFKKLEALDAKFDRRLENKADK